ncbi:MAG: O-sialoglycoprotein endopeptidase [Clostridiales bacterium]|nr:O-sialoglycoprotein endopeptidase [Clostridiales bacterium]
MTRLVLGIDTSCYTTSVALAGDGRVVASWRKLLTVKEGERGLRQSEGLFQHVNALPGMVEGLMKEVGSVEIAAVCASSRPRDVDDSYMPVFLAGVSLGKSVASILGVPFFETCHQKGHVRAAMVDSGIEKGEFIAMHLSGGTTETLFVDENLNISLLGGSDDLHAGQFVDRVGVKMGLSFPAGPHLEEMAVKGTSRSLFKLSHKDGHCSFSGAEAEAMRLIEKGGMSNEDIAAEVYNYLARAITWLLMDAFEKTNAKQALLAGGVASSRLLRKLVRERCRKKGVNQKICWAKPELSGDNACGVALIGEEMLASAKESEAQKHVYFD